MANNVDGEMFAKTSILRVNKISEDYSSTNFTPFSEWTKIVAVLATIIMIICISMILICLRERNKLKKIIAKEKAKSEMLSQWTKKIIIEKQQLIDENEQLVCI